MKAILDKVVWKSILTMDTFITCSKEWVEQVIKMFGDIVFQVAETASAKALRQGFA